eukprot:9486404-Pyramimonas_sp.AAC.2
MDRSIHRSMIEYGGRPNKELLKAGRGLSRPRSRRRPRRRPRPPPPPPPHPPRSPPSPPMPRSSNPGSSSTSRLFLHVSSSFASASYLLPVLVLLPVIVP